MGKIVINVDYTGNFAGSPKNTDIACVVTAHTFPELKEQMEVALRDHIEWMRQDGDQIPEEFCGEWSFEWNMTVRALLHYTDKLVSKSAISKETGINRQQLSHYASGFRKPRPAMRKKIVDGIHHIAEQLYRIS